MANLKTRLSIYLSGFCLFLIPSLTQASLEFATDSVPGRNYENRIRRPAAIDTIIHLPEPNGNEHNKTLKTNNDKDLPPSAVRWLFRSQLINPFATNPQFVDTTLRGFQHYDFIINENPFFAHKGNPGHVNRPLIFKPDFTSGINFGHQQIYGDYLFNYQDIIFYRPKHVFSELYYISGSQRMQLFYAKHAQKLSENLNFSFKYRLINSPGVFSRLGSRNANFYLTADYLSRNENYQAIATFTVNRIFNHESGGLKNPLGFAQDPLRDSIFLENAQSRYRDVSINFLHHFRTGINLRQRNNQPSWHLNLGRLGHSFTYNRISFVFEDKAAPYPFFEFQSPNRLFTFDSTVVHTLTNRLSWSNAPIQSGLRVFPINLTVYLTHNYHSITQPFHPEGAGSGTPTGTAELNYTKVSFDQIIQGIELNTDENRFISLGGYYNVTLGGYNNQDINAGAHINLGRIDQTRRFTAMIRFASKEPPYFFSRFTSNYVSWDHDFEKTQIINLNAHLTLRNIAIEANNYLINNNIFFNQHGLPIQNRETVGFFDLALRGSFEFGRFGFNNHLVFQQATSSAFERFPAILYHQSFFMNLSFFEGSLVTQMGLDFFYKSDYYPMSFMPMTRSFIFQDKLSTNNFSIVDGFLNAKIKRTRFFLKWHNFLPLITHSPPQYLIALHPLAQSRMIRFGVSWMFYD